MIHAYSELYLSDAQILLANAFNYALNIIKMNVEVFSKVFASSKQAKNLEIGNPAIISGKSAEELIREIFSFILSNDNLPENVFFQERTAAYWAGWALAYYQWYTMHSFKDVFTRVPLTEILAMYEIYHEMDLTNFVEDLNKRYNEASLETNLKRIREARDLSQNQLAHLSGVKVRSIQLYEQKVNDIDKAQVQTLYKISRVLGCEIEDLLESPGSIN